MQRARQNNIGNLRVAKGARLSVRDLAAKDPGALRLMKARDGTVFWQLLTNLRVDCGAALYLDSAPIIAKKGCHIDACSQSLLSLDGAKVTQKLITPLDPQGSPVTHRWLSDLVCVANLPGTNGARVITGVSQDAFIPDDFFGIMLWSPAYWFPREWLESGYPHDITVFFEQVKLASSRLMEHLAANNIKTIRQIWSPFTWQYGNDPHNLNPSDISCVRYREMFRAFYCAASEYGLRPQIILSPMAQDKEGEGITTIRYPGTQDWTGERRSEEKRPIPGLARGCQGGPKRYEGEVGDNSFQDAYVDVPEGCDTVDQLPDGSCSAFASRVAIEHFDDFADAVLEMVDVVIGIYGTQREIDIEIGGEINICCGSGTPGWDANMYHLAIFSRIIWRALHCDLVMPGEFIRPNVIYHGVSFHPAHAFFKNDQEKREDKHNREIKYDMGRSDWCMIAAKLYCWSNEPLPNGARSKFDPPADLEIPRRWYFDSFSINPYYAWSDPTVPSPKQGDFLNDNCWQAAWMGSDVPCCSPRALMQALTLLRNTLGSLCAPAASMRIYALEHGWGGVEDFTNPNFGNSDPQKWEPLQAAFDVSANAEMIASGAPLGGISNFVYGAEAGSGDNFSYCAFTRACDPENPCHAEWWYAGHERPFDYETNPDTHCQKRYLDPSSGDGSGYHVSCVKAQGDESLERQCRRRWECYEMPAFKALSVQAKLLIGRRFSGTEQCRLLRDHLGSNLCGWIDEQYQITARTLRPYVHSFCLESTQREEAHGGVYVHQIHRRGENERGPVSYAARNAIQANVHHMNRCIEAHDVIPQIRGGLLRGCLACLPLGSQPDVIWVEELPNPLILVGGRVSDGLISRFACLVCCPTGADTLTCVDSFLIQSGTLVQGPSLFIDRAPAWPFPGDANLALAYSDPISDVPPYSIIATAGLVRNGAQLTLQSKPFPCLNVDPGDWFCDELRGLGLPASGKQMMQEHPGQQPLVPGQPGFLSPQIGSELGVGSLLTVVPQQPERIDPLHQFLGGAGRTLMNLGFSGLLAGFANTNLRAGDPTMTLRIWVVGLSVCGNVAIWPKGSTSDEPPLMFPMHPVPGLGEGVHVGIFEAPASVLRMGELTAGSYTIHLRVYQQGGSTWWPWKP